MISPLTKVCCIIGNPVTHSLSPQIHNAAYKRANLDFVYVAFQPKDLKEAVAAIRSLGIKGVSVTVPFKIEIIGFLDEVDQIAQKIGAINTIVNKGGELYGTNTDWIGALKALEEKVDVAGKKVGVIGAGGAARAIVYGLSQKKAQICVFNRTKERADQLVSDFHLVKSADLKDINLLQSMSVLINTTSVGMHPNENESPIPSEGIVTGQVVFDIIYKPQETKFLQQAKKAGATIVYGYKMLLYQAVEQFKLFTGLQPNVDIMEKILLKNSK